MTPVFFVVAGVVVAACYLALTGKSPSWHRSVLKTIPLLLFAIAAYVADAPAILVWAFLASAAGDWALSRPGQLSFVAGMVAFAAAHILFVVLMLGHIGETPDYWFVCAAALIALGLSTEYWLRPKTGDLKWPVRGYVTVIMSMGLAGLGLPQGRIIATIGAILFISSDLILSIELFVMKPGHRFRHLAEKYVWISYIAAQVALLIGLSE